MDVSYCIRELKQNAEVIQHMTAEIPAEQARWKPSPESWSMVEVVSHLVDEEREDFRVRIQFILSGDGDEPPPIYPQEWVVERSYNQRDLVEMIVVFLNERSESLMWLKGLTDPDWDATYTASWGSIRAGDLLASWTAHDLLHIRQLNELKYAYGAQQLAPYNPAYAGEW
jgi:hypothetical protein